MGEQGFEHLDFYQDSLKLVKAAYRLASELPDYERYNLADQLRRAACSVALNIAEGYGRYHYLYIARGSLAETLSAFLIARNLDYCTDKQLRWVEEIQERIEKNLNGYCRFIRSQQQGNAEYGSRYIREERDFYEPSQFPITDIQSLTANSQSLIADPQSPTGEG